MKRGRDFFSGIGETLPPPPDLLLPLFLSSSKVSFLTSDLLTLGILPRLWSGCGIGDILPSFSLGEEGELSFSRVLFLDSVLDSSLDLLLYFELLLPDDDLELEDFFESDLEDLLDGLRSFLDLESDSLEESVFFSVFLSLDGPLRLGSRLLVVSLDSVFSSTCTKVGLQNMRLFMTITTVYSNFCILSQAFMK